MKRIYRSSTNKKLGGLCGGLAETFDMDPTSVRLLAIFLALSMAAGILPVVVTYIVAWIIVPIRPAPSGLE